MSLVRSLAKSFIVRLLGKEAKPRRILSGLASGYRISVSPAEKLSYLLGTDEPHLQKAIRQYVAPGDTVYDIGANLGYVSLALAKKVGTQGRVIAFEPLPQNIAAFRRHIEINRIRHVELIEFAASDKAGSAVLRVAENCSTASMVWHRNNQEASEFSVSTISIDELVEGGRIAYPKFVKIDVEGAEALVLQGMRRTIAGARPVLFVECSEAGREKSWHLMRYLQYRCRSAITRQWINTLEQYRHSDYLWLPESKS